MALAHSIPEMVGVSELRTRQSEILKQLSAKPVVLAYRNRPLAVLVAVKQWNSLIEELENLRDMQIAMERLAEASQSPDALQSLEDVEAELTTEGLLGA